MLNCERTSVMNFENAIRGARNPMNSWGRMDSGYDEDGNFVLGPNDRSLAIRLRNAGSDHRKYIRQIFVSVDITAPLYWWKEYDTYKVATVANSTSTMHKIHSKPFSIDDFSHDHSGDPGIHESDGGVFREGAEPLSGDEEQGRLVRYDPTAPVQLQPDEDVYHEL